jgi:hypothetical protein
MNILLGTNIHTRNTATLTPTLVHPANQRCVSGCSNVTVRGAPGIPTAPLVDLNFANEVINVCPGCVLTLADLVIANSRRGTGEGLDAITGEGAALRSMIVLRNVVQLRPACVPARDAGLALAETPRPAAAAGSQQQQYELRDVEFRVRVAFGGV